MNIEYETVLEKTVVASFEVLPQDFITGTGNQGKPHSRQKVIRPRFEAETSL